MNENMDLQEEVLGLFKDRKQNELLRLIHKHNINETDPVWVILDSALASFITLENMQTSVNEVAEHIGRFKKSVYDAASVSGAEVKDIIVHTLKEGSDTASAEILIALTKNATEFSAGVDMLMKRSIKQVEEASDKAVREIKSATAEMTKETLSGFKVKLDKVIEDTSSNMIQFQISKNIAMFSGVCIFFMVVGAVFGHFA
jgi:predicted transcriptional regulator